MDTDYKNLGLSYWRYSAFSPWHWNSNRVTERVCGEPMKAENAPLVKSQYGYTWRGISRTNDRELGIAGGELIIFEIRSNTVLAFRRNFAKSGAVKNNLTGTWWLTAGSCPQASVPLDKKLRKKEHIEFVMEVLKPASTNREQRKGDLE